MDHHCPWVNACVGHYNQKYFLYFLIFSIMGCLHGSLLLIFTLSDIPYAFYDLKQQHYNLYLTHIFCIGLSVGIVIFVSLLAYYQILVVVLNRTSIENWILKKVRKINYEFQNPYDLGIVKNIKQFYLDDKILDGYKWPLKEGYDQYSLSIEQIKLKKFKAEHSLTYLCITKFDGSYPGIFNYGFSTILTSPWIGEEMASIIPEDYIQITHWKRNWLYGMKLKTIYPVMTGGLIFEETDVKGWIPRESVKISDIQLHIKRPYNKQSLDNTKKNI